MYRPFRHQNLNPIVLLSALYHANLSALRQSHDMHPDRMGHLYRHR